MAWIQQLVMSHGLLAPNGAKLNSARRNFAFVNIMLKSKHRITRGRFYAFEGSSIGIHFRFTDLYFEFFLGCRISSSKTSL